MEARQVALGHGLQLLQQMMKARQAAAGGDASQPLQTTTPLQAADEHALQPLMIMTPL
ncbi:hypothetical protein Efla_007881 [Eimeria flavescens]